jgi:hypothetical protein
MGEAEGFQGSSYWNFRDWNISTATTTNNNLHKYFLISKNRLLLL